MSEKKIAWEKWDEDILQQEIAEDFHESYYEEEEGQQSLLDTSGNEMMLVGLVILILILPTLKKNKLSLLKG